MLCNKKKPSTMSPVVRLLATVSLALTALLASPAALAVDSGDIVVVSAKGEVHFTVNGAARVVRPGGVLELPATLRTGRDGAVELKQGATTVSVGPETLLEFPALEKRGAPIDRIVQPRGNAFYNIGKREGRKLRVETPYLVGVIKGTQFNVAAEDDGTTISLFEGLLEVRATDDSAVVDLKAGEIAARKRGDKSISVLKMDGGNAPPTGPRAPAGGSSNNGTPSPDAPRLAPPNGDGDSSLVDRSDIDPLIPAVVDRLGNTGVAAGTNTSMDLGTGVEVGASAAASAGDPIGVGANAAVNAPSGAVDLAAGTRVDVGLVDGGSLDVAASTDVSAGPVSVDTGTAVSLGGGSLDVSTSTTVDAGPIDLGSRTDLSVSGAAADLTTTTTVDAGPVAADVGASASVALGAGTVDTGATASVDAGPLTTDVGTAAAVDLGAGTVATTVDVGASTPLAAVDTGVSVAADVGAGTIDLGLSVAGTDLGLGLDLGLDDKDDSTPDTDTGTIDTDTKETGPVVDLGGVLDGLLRRRKK
jgi:hypothetical protein